MKTPLIFGVQPLKLPDSARDVVLHLLFLPFVLVRFNLSYILPIEAWNLVSLVALAAGLQQNFGRCAQELMAVSGQGHRYKDLALAAEGISYKWIPLPPQLSSPSDAFLAGSLSEVGACIAIKSSLQVSTCLVSIFPNCPSFDALTCAWPLSSKLRLLLESVFLNLT